MNGILEMELRLFKQRVHTSAEFCEDFYSYLLENKKTKQSPA